MELYSAEFRLKRVISFDLRWCLRRPFLRLRWELEDPGTMSWEELTGIRANNAAAVTTVVVDGQQYRIRAIRVPEGEKWQTSPCGQGLFVPISQTVFTFWRSGSSESGPHDIATYRDYKAMRAEQNSNS